MNALTTAVAGFLFSALSAVPLLLGLVMACRHARRGTRAAYLSQLIAGSIAGAVALVLLWDALFSDGLSRSSTSALIFVVVPVYALMAYAVAYAVTRLALIRTTAKPVSPALRKALLIPAAMLLVLVIGFVNTGMANYNANLAATSAAHQAATLTG